MKKTLVSTGLGALLVTIASTSGAQDATRQLQPKYPNKPIRVLVGQAPGGGVDTVSRAVALRLTDRLGYGVVVDNRAGAAGTIAARVVAQAPADGYTLLIMSTGTLITSMLLRKIDYDIGKAYAPIALLSSQPYLLAVSPQLPVGSVRDLIAYAKARPPGSLNYASTGIGSTSHLGTELFKSLAGIDMVHIAYKGVSPALVDLVSGQVQVAFATAVSVIAHVKSGRVKGLAIAAGKRMQTLPDLPTVNESGLPGYELSVEYGMFAPSGTPAATVTTLNREIGQIMHSAEMTERLAADGAEAPSLHSPAAFASRMQADIAKWNKFFKTSTVRFD